MPAARFQPLIASESPTEFDAWALRRLTRWPDQRQLVGRWQSGPQFRLSGQMAFHVRLQRQVLFTEETYNLTEAELLQRFVDPWLAGKPIIIKGRTWVPERSRISILEGPDLTSTQRSWVQGWTKAMELSENVTDRFLHPSPAPRPDEELPALEREPHIESVARQRDRPLGEMNAANPMLDTASQRPATGMDVAARKLILKTLEGCSNQDTLHGFWGDDYANFDDYTRAVREVWLDGPADRLINVVKRAADEQPAAPSVGAVRRSEEAVIEAVLLYMPEPDFRVAVFKAFSKDKLNSTITRITSICRKRGIPWEFNLSDGFGWIGDEQVAASAVHPALSAIEDPRLVSAKGHFESARSELALGTSSALPQSVHQSACAVESAMKAVLKHRGIAYDEKDTAFKLFDQLVAAGLVPEFMRFCVLAAASPRNKAGGHGADEEPHNVPQEIAEAVLASTAVAIAYLRKLLP